VLEFRYFMLRLRVGAEAATARTMVAGVVERLGSGERRDFSNAEELVQVMTTWTDTAPIDKALDSMVQHHPEGPFL
jgi:hypothetical protein